MESFSYFSQFFMSSIFILILTCTRPVIQYAAYSNAKQLRALSMWLNNHWHLRQTYEDQYKTLENQTENILPVSLTVSLSIQFMTTFKPSSGMQSNLFFVGVGGFILNFLRGITGGHYCCYAQLHALSVQWVHAQRGERSAVHNVRACKRINQCMIDLHWFKQTHELKMDMFWICLKSWGHDFVIWICRFHGGNILCQVINSWPISALGFIHEDIKLITI